MLKQKFVKLGLGVCAVMVAIASPLQLSQNVSADRYSDQLRALQAQVDQQQAKANELRKQGDSLQAALDTITAEKNGIQAQINLNQAKYEKLTADIEANKIKLANNQAALGGIIADLYVDDAISPLEMLASSDNVGEYMDKQEFRSAASEKLNTTITAIKDLKTQLESDQKEVQKVLEEQKSQTAALAAKEAQQKTLVDQTRGEQEVYQQQVASTRAQMAEVAAQQRAALARLTSGGKNSWSVGSFQVRNYSGNSPCGGGGYPLCGPMDSYADQWSLYNRECVSFAAWAAYNRFGKYVTSFSGAGNAGQWPSTAQSLMGASVNGNPEVGSVAILPPTPGLAPIGHAMVVEGILEGGWVRVSQYNFGGTGEYSTMDIHASGVVFVHFRDR